MSVTKDFVIRFSSINEEKKLTSPMCKMHFAKQPMKISKGDKQYLYDEIGT